MNDIQERLIELTGESIELITDYIKDESNIMKDRITLARDMIKIIGLKLQGEEQENNNSPSQPRIRIIDDILSDDELIRQWEARREELGYNDYLQ